MKPLTPAEINALLENLEDDPLMLSDEHLRRSTAVAEVWANPSSKAKLTQRLREAWEAPGARQARALALSKALSTPQARAKRSEVSKLSHSSPESRARQAAAARLSHQDPVSSAKRSAAIKKPVEFEGVAYPAMAECRAATGLSRYVIVKHPTFKYLSKGK